MQFMRKMFRTVMVLGLIFTLLIAASFYWQVFQRRSNAAAVVEIPKGSSLAAVSAILSQNGVVRSPRMFALYGRVSGAAGRLHAGEYEFARGMTMKEVMDKIVRGDVKRYSFTVIEGWNLRDIDKMLRSKPFVTPAIADEFMRLVYDPNYITTLGFPGISSLEGYLFPDTYLIARPKGARDIIDPMIKRYRAIFTDALRQRAQEMGMTEHQVITLASIIEKETGRADERPIISSVFHNRLKKGIQLATDPTVIYGIENFDGNLRRSDLTRPGPYNTYLNPGLPPGPIASPGAESIRAALYPAQTNYLYFVSRNDGSHYFSQTMAQHARAVQHYQVQRSTDPLE